MKAKKILVYITIISLLAGLTGCGKEPAAPAQVIGNQDSTKSDETDADTGSDNEDEAEAVTGNDASEYSLGFESFLKGEGAAVTGEYYQNDLSTIPSGEYTFEELARAAAQIISGQPEAKNTFVDLNGDGKEEMILAFEDFENLGMGWAVVLCYRDDILTMTYDCSYGYRSEACFYDNGYLTISGSGGAGLYVSSVYSFDENCNALILDCDSTMFSNFATSIGYDLSDSSIGDEIFTDDYDYEASELEVYEHVEYGGAVPDYLNPPKAIAVAIYVAKYSENETNRAIEEQLIEQLTAAGAELLSDDEYSALAKAHDFGNEIEWTPLDMPPVLYINMFDYVYPQPEDYIECFLDDSEYSQKVLLFPSDTIKDVSVYTLDVTDFDADGTPVFNIAEQFAFYEVTADCPLVVYLSFDGDGIPRNAISYTDAKGRRHNLTIEQSGYDGSLLLSGALFNE